MTFLILLLILLAALVIFIAARPDEFKVERSTVIDAPASAIFEHVNTLRNWHAWSPWVKLDPNAQTTFEGPSAGTGAKMAWSGNKKMGKGSMTITESQPQTLIHFRLDFIEPFQATNTAEFNFIPEGSSTRVTWSMQGKNTFISKAISFFMNCDKMLAGYFDEGLGNLKRVVQKG